jgi:hypothetical protein
MICYKLTDRYQNTRSDIHWEPGEWREVEYTGELCSGGVLHCYDTPEDAVFFDPIHAELLPTGLLWEAEYEGPSVSDGTKRGVGRMRVLRQVTPPEMTTEQRVERAIRAAKTVCEDPGWNRWVDRWLSGEDRSAEAAWAAWASARAARSAAKAARAARAAAEAAAEAAAAEWARAARAAARAEKAAKERSLETP